MAQAVRTFIDEVTPQLETVNILLNREFSLKWEGIDGKKTLETTKVNIAEARRFLSLYNRTFGQIDLYLSLMTSNVTLPQFIKEKGFDFSDEEIYQVIVVIQPEIRMYWDSTYGTLTKKFSKIRDDLKHLRDTLEEEIALLESLPETPFYQGIEKNLHALALFRQERSIFWEKLVKDAQVNDEEIRVVEGFYAGQRAKVKGLISAHIEVTREGVSRDMEQTQGALRKALLVFTYITGVLKMLYTLRKMLLSEGGKRLVGAFIALIAPKPEKDLAKITVLSQNALKDLGGGGLVALSEAL